MVVVMGSSRNLFLLFVVLSLLSSQVAPSNAQTNEHIDKKTGNVVHLPSMSGRLSLVPEPLQPDRPFCDRNVYGVCISRGGLPKRRRCEYANQCRRPCCGKAQEFTKDQFKDDFHN